jgi:hypothetical protein
VIFVDTAAWAAISIRNDRFHPAAARAQKRLRRSGERLLTSNFVLDETYTLLLYQAGYAAAIRFHHLIQMMIAAGVLSSAHVTEDIEDHAWEVFKTFNADKEWSFTDCTSKVIMDITGTTEVFTFDHHFDQMGFICVPGRVDQQLK